MNALAIGGVSVLAAAVGALVYLMIAPGRPRVSRARLDPTAEPRPSLLTGATNAATERIGEVLERRRNSGVALALERAGVHRRPQDFVFLVAVATFVGAVVGFLLGGVLLALLFAGVVLLLVRVRLGSLADRRRRLFADQLDDSLQLLASSLRAGHSLPQALDSVAREAQSPTSEEFSRVINEMRVGRDMGTALADTAARMGSDDFLWATQAIAINREVGGNLAEVLDGVGHTIRERNAIRRQVKALSAEGRLSAIILMVLPFGVAGFLLLTNPSYILTFTETTLGLVMMVVALVLLVVGGLWLRRVVRISF